MVASVHAGAVPSSVTVVGGRFGHACRRSRLTPKMLTAATAGGKAIQKLLLLRLNLLASFCAFCRGTPWGALGQGKPSPYKRISLRLRRAGLPPSSAFENPHMGVGHLFTS